MKEKLSKSRLGTIKKKLKASDRVLYIISSAIIEEEATTDMKLLIAELENCWKELKDLDEAVRLLTEKTISLTKQKQISRNPK